MMIIYESLLPLEFYFELNGTQKSIDSKKSKVLQDLLF